MLPGFVYWLVLCLLFPCCPAHALPLICDKNP